MTTQNAPTAPATATSPAATVLNNVSPAAPASTAPALAPVAPNSGLLAVAPVDAPKPSAGEVLFGKPAEPAAPAVAAPAPADTAPAAPIAAAELAAGETLVGSAEPEAPAEPVTYKFDLPPDANLDQARIDTFASHIAKLNGGKGLSAEDANALLKFGLEDAKAADVAIQAEWQKTQQSWVDQLKADPVLGGDKLMSEVVPTIKKAINQYATTPALAAELNQMLNSTGMGNHPVFIRTLYGMARALTEGAAVQRGGPVAPNRRPADILFPPTKTN